MVLDKERKKAKDGRKGKKFDPCIIICNCFPGDVQAACAPTCAPGWHQYTTLRRIRVQNNLCCTTTRGILYSADLKMEKFFTVQAN